THVVRIQAEGLSDVFVTDVKIAPAGQTGWHAHPGPAFVSIKSGVATEDQADDGDFGKVGHPTGTGLIEALGHRPKVRNAGPHPLELVILFLLPKGAAPRIDMPDPGTCPF